jgi:outer membrane immunogenic protein
MKRLLITAALSLMGVANASAADLAARPYTKAPPVVVAAYDWSGFYIGGNGGGASSRKCWDVNPFTVDFLGAPINISGPEGCHNASGATFGGQVGYRWQSAAWVLGLEAQGNWANLEGSNASQLAFFAGVADRTKIDAIGLFTGQVGYSWKSLLLYVKGGAAVTHDKYEGFLTAPAGLLPTGFVSNQGSETRWGGVAGIGGEYLFTPSWSFALEYDHLFMGDRDVAMSYNPPYLPELNHTEHIRQDLDMVTARFNYRFGGPVAARY